jgi:hypothetical protein
MAFWLLNFFCAFVHTKGSSCRVEVTFSIAYFFTALLRIRLNAPVANACFLLQSAAALLFRGHSLPGAKADGPPGTLRPILRSYPPFFPARRACLPRSVSLSSALTPFHQRRRSCLCARVQATSRADPTEYPSRHRWRSSCARVTPRHASWTSSLPWLDWLPLPFFAPFSSPFLPLFPILLPFSCRPFVSFVPFVSQQGSRCVLASHPC